MEYISPIITAIGTILIAWLSYNQYTKNKQTDFKIEQWKKKETQQNRQRCDSIAKIYGVLWKLLYDLEADRVFIIQPHPLVNNLYVTITLEVCSAGVSPAKGSIRSMPMQNIPKFCSELAARDFIYYENATINCKDEMARAILCGNGSGSVLLRRMGDRSHDWTGTIVVDYLQTKSFLGVDYRKNMLADAANKIQYILPEYEGL